MVPFGETAVCSRACVAAEQNAPAAVRHNLLPHLYFYSGNFHLQAEDRKDSDDEKSDRNRPWWKKRFVSAIPKGEDSLVTLSMPSSLK